VGGGCGAAAERNWRQCGEGEEDRSEEGGGGRDDKYNVRWKEMLANQFVRIALLKATSAAKKRNTDS
jgi:hypothetical protein